MKFQSASLFDELDDFQKKTADDFHTEMLERDIRMKDYSKVFSVRFLIGRNWDLDKTREFICNHLLWKELSYLHFMSEELPVNKENLYTSGSIIGNSKLGHPLFFSFVGGIDIAGVRNTTPYLSIANQRFKITKEILKACDEASIKYKKDVHQAYAIFDFSGASLSSLVGDFRAFNSAIGIIVSDNYPEVFNKLFFVNAKTIFATLYGFISRFLTERVKSKIFILDSNPRETLLKYIDEDQLPKYYGGTLEDPPGDPKCTNRIKWPPKIDPSQYYGDVFKKHDKTKLIQLEIPRSSKKEILLGELKAGQKIDWTVISDRYDIGFGIELRDTDGFSYKILPPLRINSYLLPEEGYMKIKRPGKYYIIFDNSYSYFNGKNVYYNFTVDK